MLDYINMDIETADELLKADNPKTYNHVVLCCQQVIEKALKAFLAKKGETFGSYHDTNLLCKKASKINSDFEKFRDVCAEAKSAYIATHYPDYDGNKIEFTRQQCEYFYSTANEMYELVRINL
jgi:HEPN domain-containing protein